MNIGVDLDGTITKAGLYNPSVRLPWWLFYLLVPLVLFLRPDKLAVEKLRTMKKRGCKIIIVTARPAQLKRLTGFLLTLYGAPYDKLCSVGFGKGTKERKLQVIKEEEIAVFVDDNQKCREFLEKNAIRAVGNTNQLS